MGPALGAQVADASFVTVLISAGTVASSLMSARLIARFGPGDHHGGQHPGHGPGPAGLLLRRGPPLALPDGPSPWGWAPGPSTRPLNNYVALHYKAAHTSFISCFYGVGVTLSPYLMSLTLSGGRGAGGAGTV